MVLVTQQYNESKIYFKRHFKTYEYDEFFQLILLPNQSFEQENVCRLPKLDFIGHTNFEKPMPCRMKHEWGYLKQKRWYLNHSALQGRSIEHIYCKYRNIIRITDFKMNYSSNETLVDQQIINNPVIEVFCYFKNRLSYDNIHVQIVDNLDDIYEQEKPDLFTSNDCKPLNILLLSYDSLSRVSWVKRLPKTTKFLVNDLNFTILYGKKNKNSNFNFNF